MNKRALDKWMFLTAILLVVVLVIFENSEIDIHLQNHLYNFDTGRWIVDRNDPVLKFLFYDGIKIALIIFASILLLSLIFFRKNDIVRSYRSGIIIVLMSAIAVPSAVGILKNITNTPCPRQIIEFNGCYPYVKVFSKYPSDFKQTERVACFPAGHASGGFALLSLFFLFKSRKNRIIALLAAFVTGWSMGLYKMMIGDHFLSHTVVSMILAWLIILINARIAGRFESRAIRAD